MSNPPAARPRWAWASIVLATLIVVAGTATPARADKALDDLLLDLQLIPLEGQVPSPFSLERMADGKKVTLAEHRGRLVMLYFWATW